MVPAEPRDSGDNDGRIPACDFYVIVLASRALAQVGKVEPGYSLRASSRPNFAAVDVEHQVFRDVAGCRLVEEALQLLECPAVVGCQERACLFKKSQAVIRIAFNAFDRRVRFDQFDSGQETLPLQAIPIQFIRMRIRCRNERDAALEETFKQPGEDHRITDVVDVKLIEAKHAGLCGNIGCDSIDRVFNVAERFESFVRVAHHAVKVDSFFALDSQRFEEEVHQKGLAAADPAPQVQSSTDFLIGAPVAPEETQQALLPGRLLQTQLQGFEYCDDGLLRRIALVAFPTETVLVSLANTQNTGYPFRAAAGCNRNDNSKPGYRRHDRTNRTRIDGI